MIKNILCIIECVDSFFGGGEHWQKTHIYNYPQYKNEQKKETINGTDGMLPSIIAGID